MFRRLGLLLALLPGFALAQSLPSPQMKGDNVTVTATGGSVARAMKDRAADVFNVRDYGATCTGASHNDTAAFQAAANAAAVSKGSDFWANSVGVVYVPAGYCSVSSFTLPPRVSLRGDGIGQSFIEQRQNAGASLIVVPPEATYAPSNPAQWNKSSLGVISGLSLTGNTGGKHGIEYSDAAASSIAGWIRNVYIVGFTQDGIYAGTNRAEGNVNQVLSVSNGGNGLTVSGYDWYVAQTQLGSNTGDGLYLASGGSIYLTDDDLYSNFKHGWELASGAGGYNYASHLSFDRNKQSGVYNSSLSSDLVISSASFADNSAAAAAAYAHITLNSAGGTLALNNVRFAQDASYPNVASYLIQQTGTASPITLRGIRIASGTTPYVTANYSLLVTPAGVKTTTGCGIEDLSGGPTPGSGACDLQAIRASGSQGATGKAALAAGENNTAAGEASFATGQNNSVSGFAGFSTGSGNVVQNSASYGTALGHKSNIYAYAGFVNAGSDFASAGDAQDGISFPLIATTTGAQSTRLTADGSGTASSSNSVPMQNSQSIVLSCNAVANSTAGNDAAAFYLDRLLLRRGGGASTVIMPRGSSVAFTAGDATAGAASAGLGVTVTTDTTLGGPNITAASASGTWHWVLSCRTPMAQ